MSPRTFSTPAPQPVADSERRLWIGLGIKFRDARIAKRLTVRNVASKAGMSTDVVYLIETGRGVSPHAVIRLAQALGLRLDFDLVDPRQRRASAQRWADPVHSAMGELEAAHLRKLSFPVGADEPYQHFQFAGRADIVSWSIESRALLHLENRTRFPDMQDAAGSYNSKRAYLGAALAERLGVRRWASETHVMVGAWTTEVLHVVRLREETFRSLCPDSAEAFAAWWRGDPPHAGTTSAFVALDPLAHGRERQFADLSGALRARARHSGYAELAARLGANDDER